jgi:hypothetical protein
MPTSGRGPDPASRPAAFRGIFERSFKMAARIFKPAKTAMQSGTANTKEWVLEYEPAQPRMVEPLMGWTSSTDMRSQVRLRFETADEAVAYCKRHMIPFQLSQAREAERRKIAYADNFAYGRRGNWTH